MIVWSQSAGSLCGGCMSVGRVEAITSTDTLLRLVQRKQVSSCGFALNFPPKRYFCFICFR